MRNPDTVADEKPEQESTVVERWLTEQQQWQRTVMTYVDSLVKSDDFLTHLGNAMRGSLLAGKPYPTTPPPEAAAPQTPADDRLDQVLFTLHKMEGQLEDLRLSVEELRAAKEKKKDRKRKDKE
jgi:hypothetical protein